MNFLPFFLLFLNLEVFAVIDSQLESLPQKNHFQFFLDAYIPWFEKEFNHRFPQDAFFQRVLKELDHWRTPLHKDLDQLLIGEGFSRGKPFYTFRIYVHEKVRDAHPEKPFFIEISPGETCFLYPAQLDEIKWDHVPRYKNTLYLKHICQDRLTYISMLSQDEIGEIKNPFRGQVEHELRTFDRSSLLKVLFFVKTTHTGRVPKKHIPYINKHGEKLLVPFDKYSVDRAGDMIIYYP
jgi:hypothetical protein